MTDISKCNGIDCTLKETCYRFTAPADPYWQAYAAFSQDQETGICEDYWEVNIQKPKKKSNGKRRNSPNKI